MTTLVIVESPGKIKKLTAILGAGYRVVASVGHVRDLPRSDMGVAAPDFVPKYVPTDRGKDVLAKLKKHVQEASAVILATDPDREGEAIAWHLLDALRLRGARRVTFNAIEAAVVRAAMAAPRDLDMHRVHAQEARRVLDRLVGYSVSPALSNRTGKSLSAGRVQTPAVRIIVDREREIQAFTSTEHYGVALHFAGGTWKAEWDTTPFRAPESQYLLDATLAEQVATVRAVRVVGFADSTSRKAPPPPFMTSTLQQAGSVRLKMKPKATMDAAQKLYEAGHISYHRTDSPNLAGAGIDAILAYARDAGLPLASNPRTWKAKDGAQEGHEAIRPLHVDVTEAGDSEAERALYRLIWARAVASQLADATFAVRIATLAGDLDGRELTFVARGKTTLALGWKAIYAAAKGEADDADDAAAEADNPVPALSEGDALEATDGHVLTKTTKAPSRFTEASLIKRMEELGIGRPSTYAPIMDNIQQRNYVEEDAKAFLHPSMLGLAIVDAVVGTFAFAELEYTRGLEAELDRIAEGGTTYRNVVAAAYDKLTAELATMAVSPGVPIEHPCPDCGKALQLRPGKFGQFWACIGYPMCNTSLPNADGKPGVRAPVAVPTEHKCTKCKKPLHRRTKTGTGAYDFFGCSGYPKCKASYKVSPDGLPVESTSLPKPSKGAKS